MVSGRRIMSPLSTLRHQQNVDEWERKHPVIAAQEMYGVNVFEHKLRDGDTLVVYHYSEPHELKYIKRGSAHKASFKELDNFMRLSPVMKLAKTKYSSGSFKCMDFVMQLHNIAEAAHLKCGIVSITYLRRKTGHQINIFDTTKAGWQLYFPQSQELVDFEDFLEDNEDESGRDRIKTLDIYW